MQNDNWKEENAIEKSYWSDSQGSGLKQQEQ